MPTRRILPGATQFEPVIEPYEVPGTRNNDVEASRDIAPYLGPFWVTTFKDEGREDEGREDEGREDEGREDEGREDGGEELLARACSRVSVGLENEGDGLDMIGCGCAGSDGPVR